METNNIHEILNVVATLTSLLTVDSNAENMLNEAQKQEVTEKLMTYVNKL